MVCDARKRNDVETRIGKRKREWDKGKWQDRIARNGVHCPLSVAAPVDAGVHDERAAGDGYMIKPGAESHAE